jgi:predicted dehydrogenase
MSVTKTRVAVVGTGEIATRAHIPAYLNNKDVDLVALVDADEVKLKKAAKKFRIRNSYSSIDELLQKQKLDAISICTPPNTHAEIALKAFENDVHVLCEKPLATKAAEGKQMYDASLKAGKILMVGFNLRFQPNYKKAHSIIRSGQLGHIYLVECNNLSANPLLIWSKSTWFFKPEAGGGVLSDKGPHVFDLLNYAFDDFPIAVSALATTYFDSPVEDSCVCTLEYPGNRLGIGKMSWLSSQYLEGLSIHGTSQSLFASPEMLYKVNASDIPEIAVWKKTSEILFNMKFPNLPMRHVKRVDLIQSEIDHFVNKVRTGQKYCRSSINGLNALITYEAAKKSLDTGEKVKISPIKG